MSYLTFIRDISAEVDNRHRAATSWTSHVQRGGIFRTVIPKELKISTCEEIKQHVQSGHEPSRRCFIIFLSSSVFFFSILCVEILVQSKCE